MIVGKYLDNTPLPKKTQWPLFMYNKYIDSVLQKKTPDNHAWLMDTNNIIRKLYNSLGIGVKTGEAYNPIYLYNELIKFMTKNHTISKNIIIHKLYLKFMKYGYDFKNIGNFSLLTTTNIKNKQYIPHILSLRSNGYENHGNVLKQKIKIVVDKVEYIYQLDSCVMLDNMGEHFCSCITFNGKQLIHDGYMESRHEPLQWKSYLCDKKNIRKSIILNYENGYKNTFNFAKTPYCDAFYYRIK